MERPITVVIEQNMFLPVTTRSSTAVVLGVHYMLPRICSRVYVWCVGQIILKVYHTQLFVVVYLVRVAALVMRSRGGQSPSQCLGTVHAY